MADIPEGYGIIAGRSSKHSQAAIDGGYAAGAERRLVKAVPEGYLVPDAVLEAYSAGIGEPEAEAEPEAEPTPTSDWKNAEIKEWAEAHDVDLGDATTKADMLDAITASGTP
jgi:hypothetical protein